MAFKVVFAADAERDFELIFDFLVESYLGFGESEESAIERAFERVQSIRKDAISIGKAPFRGTAHSDLMPGLRHVTLNRAIFWFDIVEATEEVRIFAVFFGGQDHRRRMLVGLLSSRL